MENETAHRTTSEVAENHISAVLGGDPKQMADDYAEHAILERGDVIYRGKDKIQDYFRTVPKRLGSAQIFFDKLIINESNYLYVYALQDKMIFLDFRVC